MRKKGSANGLLDNLVSFWDMAPGAIAADSHGSNDLTMVGTVTSTETSIGMGGLFDGNSYLTANIIPPAGDFVFSIWFFTDDVSPYGYKNSLLFGVRADVQITSEGVIGTGIAGMGQTTVATKGMPVHLCFGRNGDTLYTYLDSDLVTSSQGNFLYSSDIQIGRGLPEFPIEFFWNNWIDDAALWAGRGMTQEMATLLYNSGAGVPYSEFD